MPVSEEDRQRIYEEEKVRQEIREELEREGRGTRPRLRKSGEDRVLFGVAGGIAEHFDVDPLLVRVGFVGLCFVTGIGLVLYVVLALLLPRRVDGKRGSDLKLLAVIVLALIAVFVLIPLLIGAVAVLRFLV